MHLLTLASCFSLTSLVLAVVYCPPLGPVFSAPQSLSNNSVIGAAVANLSATIDALRGAGNATSASYNSSTTSFSINFYSIHESAPLFEYHHTADVLSNTTNGTRSVTGDTVYRIGSVSKVFTVLALLLHEEKLDWRDPITKYVPELSACTNSTGDQCGESGEVNGVQWEKVTLGALGAQLAGIPRDYGVAGLSDMQLPWAALGFPTLNESSRPACVIGNNNQTKCSREDYLNGLRSRHPVYPPFATPVYSNAAFVLLGLALESITGHDYETTLLNDIFKAAHMTHSSSRKPPDAMGVIPIGTNDWALDLGLGGPAGGLYSSSSDLSLFGRAILNNTLLPPHRTRAWLKPHTHTSSLTLSVGRPWEIGRSSTVTLDGRVVDFYTKGGSVTQYNSGIVLIPDYDVGFTVLVAGGGGVLPTLVETVIRTLVPAVEKVGRDQAAARYAGRYEAAAPLNSSIDLLVQREAPGLKIGRWISNGSDFLAEYTRFFGPPTTQGGGGRELDVRLYPTGLTDSSSPSSSSKYREESFRAVFQLVRPGNPSSDSSSAEPFFLNACSSWGALDGLVYGNNSLDDFVFRSDERDGSIVGLEARALRVELRKL